MKLRSSFKRRKRSVQAIAVCLSLGVGGVSVNAQEGGVIIINAPEEGVSVEVQKEEPMNTLPFYEAYPLAVETELTLPQLRTSNDEDLYTGKLRLNWVTGQFEVLYSHPFRQFSGYQSDPGFLREKAQKLEEYVDSLVGNGDEGGIVVRVDINTNSWRGAKGFSQLEKCCPKRRVFSNKFRIASLTKVFTASVVLNLVEEGLVELEDPLEKWFWYKDWYSKLPSDSKSVTIRELLGMKSGIASYDPNPICDPLRVYTPEELLKLGFQNTENPENPLIPIPKRGEYNYSNTNYILLGLLIEEVTGESVEKNLREKIFEPLGLFNTAFPVNAGIPYYYDDGYTIFPSVSEASLREAYGKSGLSQSKIEEMLKTTLEQLSCVKNRSSSTLPSVEEKGTMGGIMYKATYYSPTQAWAAGAIISNVDELVEAIKAQIDGKTPYIPPYLVAERSKDRLKDMKFKGNGCQGYSLYYGLGVKEYVSDNDDEHVYYGHDGDINGYNSAVLYNPQNGVAVGVNLNMYDMRAPSAMTIAQNIINIMESEDHLSCSVPSKPDPDVEEILLIINDFSNF